MTQIRCTQKLLKEISSHYDLSSIEVCDDAFVWYANLFKIGRYKYLIFVDEKTLFSFIIPRVKRADFINLQSVFRNGLQNALKIIHIGQIQSEYMLLRTTNSFEITKTANKTVLGNVNSLITDYKVIIGAGDSFNEAIIKANKSPQRNLGWHTSSESVSNNYC